MGKYKIKITNYKLQILEILAKMPPAARGSFEKRAEIPLDPTKLFIICLFTVFARGSTNYNPRVKGLWAVGRGEMSKLGKEENSGSQVKGSWN